MERRSIFKIKFDSFKPPRSVFSRLKTPLTLIQFFVVSVTWNHFALSCCGKWEWYYRGLSVRSPNTE